MYAPIGDLTEILLVPLPTPESFEKELLILLQSENPVQSGQVSGSRFEVMNLDTHDTNSKLTPPKSMISLPTQTFCLCHSTAFFSLGVGIH